MWRRTAGFDHFRKSRPLGHEPDGITHSDFARIALARASNHPFVDGNKRTGFVVGILFLELNGPTFTASEADATQAVLGLAAGKITDDEFAIWLRSNSTPL